MVRFYIIGFFCLLFFDTLGQICFKLTATGDKFSYSLDWLIGVFSSKWAYLTILSYVGSFITWITLLKKIAVGPAFAASKLQIVTIMIASFFIFKETLSTLQILGAICILIGIIFLALGEKQAYLMEQSEKEKS